MKRYIFLISVFAILAACQPKPCAETIDLEAARQTIEQLADQYNELWNTEDLEALKNMVADDGQFYGSDPSEIMDKTSLLEMYQQFFNDSTSISYDVLLRETKVSSSGKSAIVMERISFSEWSPKMPMSQTSHYVKSDDKWEIDFIVWGFVLKNEDVGKVNKALEE